MDKLNLWAKVPSLQFVHAMSTGWARLLQDSLKESATSAMKLHLSLTEHAEKGYERSQLKDLDAGPCQLQALCRTANVLGWK